MAIPEGKYVNKVVSNGETLIDLTKDTITAKELLEGTTAHIADGSIITGAMPNGEELYF